MKLSKKQWQHVQELLNEYGFGPLVTDGILGDETFNAIKLFQRSRGLEEDGIVGPITYSRLLDDTRTIPPVAHHGDIQGNGRIILTAEVIRRVTPNARADLVKVIADNSPMLEAAGIKTPLIAAHFISEIATETGGLRDLEENLNYSAKRLRQVWPSRFPNSAIANNYAHNPRDLANYVYGKRLGNHQPDDGWRYRGSGMLQTTGRFNFMNAGHVNDPEALRIPMGALKSALKYWTDHGLSKIAATDNVDRVRKTINGGTHGLKETKAYLAKAKRALRI